MHLSHSASHARGIATWRLLLTLAFATWFAPRLLADEPVLRSLAPPDALLNIEVDRPLRVLDSPFGRDLFEVYRQSAAYNQAFGGANVEKARQAKDFFESVTGTNWRDGLAQLTAGGVLFSVRASPPQSQPDLLIVAGADQPQTMSRFVSRTREEVRKKLQEAGQPVLEISEAAYREQKYFKVGDGYYAVQGRWLLLANRQAVLEQALDRVLDPAKRSPAELPEVLRLQGTGGSAPVLRATLDLKQWRGDPKVAEGLKIPSTNVGAVLLLGGYFDVLGQAETAVACLSVADDAAVAAQEGGVELRLRANAGTEKMRPALLGYFGINEPGISVAPLLRPRNAFFSSSFLRDLSALWENRADLLTGAQLEQTNEEERQRVEEKKELGLAKLLRLIGPHWRLVAAEQSEQVYKKGPAERLPAAALAIDLRDADSFRDEVVNKLELLIRSPPAVAVGQAQTTAYKNAVVTSLRFRETADSAKERPIQFNFNPAYAQAFGHFVVGSSEEIVKGTLDELERQAGGSSPPASPTGKSSAATMTSDVRLSVAQLAQYIQALRDRVTRGYILDQGLSLPQAEQEVQLLKEFLRKINQVSTQTYVAPNYLEWRLRIGGTAEQVKPQE